MGWKHGVEALQCPAKHLLSRAKKLGKVCVGGGGRGLAPTHGWIHAAQHPLQEVTQSSSVRHQNECQLTPTRLWSWSHGRVLPYTGNSAMRTHGPPSHWVLFLKGLSTREGIRSYICVRGSQQNYNSTQVDHRIETKTTIIHLQTGGQTQNQSPEDTSRPRFKGLLGGGWNCPRA